MQKIQKTWVSSGLLQYIWETEPRLPQRTVFTQRKRERKWWAVSNIFLISLHPSEVKVLDHHASSLQIIIHRVCVVFRFWVVLHLSREKKWHCGVGDVWYIRCISLFYICIPWFEYFQTQVVFVNSAFDFLLPSVHYTFLLHSVAIYYLLNY